jgi:NAD(P)-dependent dehydrogenase (short-subunit alcohol dehydrogenase family)
MNRPLDGRVAIVTGAGRGIGRMAGLLLAEAGADIVCVARTESELDEAARAIRSTNGKALSIRADIADAGDVVTVAERVLSEFGRVDMLVNNAAVVTPLGPTVGVDMEEWSRAIEVNLVGVMRLTQLLLPGMLARASGHIVNVSSGVAVGFGAMIGGNAYTTSKAALEAHTLNLAAELEGTGVKVNVLRPGTVDTAMQSWIRSQPGDDIGHELRQKFADLHAEGHLADPEKPARVIVDLMSSETTGQIVDVRAYFPD